jgi:hypothetical protein
MHCISYGKSCFRDVYNRVCCYAHPDAPLIEDYRAGDMICSECGLVVGDRYFSNFSEYVPVNVSNLHMFLQSYRRRLRVANVQQ